MLKPPESSVENRSFLSPWKALIILEIQFFYPRAERISNPRVMPSILLIIYSATEKGSKYTGFIYIHEWLTLESQDSWQQKASLPSPIFWAQFHIGLLDWAGEGKQQFQVMKISWREVHTNSTYNWRYVDFTQTVKSTCMKRAVSCLINKWRNSSGSQHEPSCSPCYTEDTGWTPHPDCYCPSVLDRLNSDFFYSAPYSLVCCGALFSGSSPFHFTTSDTPFTLFTHILASIFSLSKIMPDENKIQFG